MTQRGPGAPPVTDPAGPGHPSDIHPLLDGPEWLQRLDPDSALALLRGPSGRLPTSFAGPLRRFEQTFTDWLRADSGELDDQIARYLDVTAVATTTQAWKLYWHHHRPTPGRTELITPMWTSLPAVLAAADAGYTIRWTAVDTSLTVNHLAVAAALGEHTGAVLVTHPYGSACDTRPIRTMIEMHGYEPSRWVPIIADAGTACGAELDYRLIGAPTYHRATATVFTFDDRTQLFYLGDGAALVTTRYPEALGSLRELRDDAGFWLDTTPANEPRRMSTTAALVGVRHLPLLRPTIEDLHRRKQLLRRLLDGIPALRWRPQADQDGDTATDLIGYLPDTAAVARAVATLTAAQLPAHPLLEPAAGTTHGLAGNWHDILQAHGIDPPGVELRTAQYQQLHTGIRIPLTRLRTDDAVVEAADRLRNALT